MNKKYYIAYGSNLNLMQMRYRCPTAKVVGTALLKDYQLSFSVFATIEHRAGASVPVAVWEIDERCERLLDDYEDYPRLYRKEYLDVEVNGRTLSALVYIINRNRPAPPDENYFRVIEEGYADMGFDLGYLHQALEYTNKMIL